MRSIRSYFYSVARRLGTDLNQVLYDTVFSSDNPRKVKDLSDAGATFHAQPATNVLGIAAYWKREQTVNTLLMLSHISQEFREKAVRWAVKGGTIGSVLNIIRTEQDFNILGDLALIAACCDTEGHSIAPMFNDLLKSGADIYTRTRDLGHLVRYAVSPDTSVATARLINDELNKTPPPPGYDLDTMRKQYLHELKNPSATRQSPVSLSAPEIKKLTTRVAPPALDLGYVCG